MARWIEETLHDAWRTRLRASRVVHEVRTGHQHLVIFDNAAFGRVLMLDGVVQLTTADEFIYHEMMAHVPLFARGRPRHVLIIGGGDGGVLREVLQHSSVRRAVVCEIDRGVIDLCAAHLPEISAGAFDDPRTEVVIADGAGFVATTRERFDVIICDTTEPVGPAAAVFEREFFAGCRRCLAPGGVLVTQSGLPFAAPVHVRRTAGHLAALFADRACYLCDQPSYFGGPFALLWASDDAAARAVSLATLRRRHAAARRATRYYTPEVHKAAFALPGYVAELMSSGLGYGPSD